MDVLRYPILDPRRPWFVRTFAKTTLLTALLVSNHDISQREGEALTSSGSKDTTTQTIEAIWPLSKSCPGIGNGDQKLIPLRVFVQEVLKRSRTSYSTLLVALHYLILVMGSVPKYGNFTKEQVEDSEGCRAMQCGRRMFLAALVLASKYLQDRNYSTRAWGKISGLQVSEINTNERVFLSAVKWKLHIPEPLFQRWERIVLKYSPSASNGKAPRSCPSTYRTWQNIIPQLNPDLDQFDDKGMLISDNDSGYYSSSSRASSRDSSPHTIRSVPEPVPPAEPMPTAPCTIPRYLEPTPCETKTGSQMLPPLQPREGPLPTPTFTPRNSALCTPAVSASGLLPRTSSMAMAMAQSRKCWDETLLDRCAFSPTSSTSNRCPLRRFSRTSSTLSKTSSPPESFVWDESRNPSRSSSISSVASSASTASKPDLAWQAMRRCANMQSSNGKDETLAGRRPSSNGGATWKDPFLSRMSIAASGHEESYFDYSVGESTPFVDVREQSQEGLPTPLTIADETTPKAPRSCTPNADVPCQRTYDAAVALCELDLGRRPQFLPRPYPTSECRSRKRERPLSMDITLQSSVHDIMKSCRQFDSSRDDYKEAVVIPDDRVADTKILRGGDKLTDYDRAASDLILCEIDRHKICKNRKTPGEVVQTDQRRVIGPGSNTSSMPRKKACIPALSPAMGQQGLCARKCGGNTTSPEPMHVLTAKVQSICDKVSRSQQGSAKLSTALKENRPLHGRSASIPTVKPYLNDGQVFRENSRNSCHQAAGTELDRMLRVSRGEAIDDRPALRGGRLWGEIS